MYIVIIYYYERGVDIVIPGGHVEEPVQGFGAGRPGLVGSNARGARQEHNK